MLPAHIWSRKSFEDLPSGDFETQGLPSTPAPPHPHRHPSQPGTGQGLFSFPLSSSRGPESAGRGRPGTKLTLNPRQILEWVHPPPHSRERNLCGGEWAWDSASKGRELGRGQHSPAEGARCHLPSALSHGSAGACTSFPVYPSPQGTRRGWEQRRCHLGCEWIDSHLTSRALGQHSHS